MATLHDATVLISDNAARKAKRQLQDAFEAVEAQGAYACLDLKPDSDDREISLDDHSLLQEPHVDAINRIKRLANHLKPKVNRNQAKNGNRNGNRNGGSRNHGNNWNNRGNYNNRNNNNWNKHGNNWNKNSQGNNKNGQPMEQDKP